MNNAENQNAVATETLGEANAGNYALAHKIFKYASQILFILTLLASVVLAIVGTVQVNADIGEYKYSAEYIYRFKRVTTPDEEGYSGDENKICPVEYAWEKDGVTYSFIYTYTYEEWEALGESEVFGDIGTFAPDGETRINPVIYREKDGDRFVAFLTNPSPEVYEEAVRDVYADESSDIFSAAITLLILSVSFAVIAYFGKHFTLYEKSWFLGIMVLAAIFAIIFPEEGTNGVSGIIIMLLYLADTFLNILCELLISKQSKWNFIVSVFVEITEILICIVLSYRFATMATTLFFWLPIDIISFINWNRKKNTDRDEEELTKVRTLKGWQEILIIVGIGVWTVVVGYFLSGLDITSGLFGGNDVLEDVVCYIDACASAVGIVNGLAILFRFREQWIAWYICSILEAVINILAGQYILLVLKFGYLTNTTYGYLKWTKYIKAHPELVEEKTFF